MRSRAALRLRQLAGVGTAAAEPPRRAWRPRRRAIRRKNILDAFSVPPARSQASSRRLWWPEARFRANSSETAAVPQLAAAVRWTDQIEVVSGYPRLF